MQVNIDAQVGLMALDTRSLSSGRTNLVHDRILDLEGTKVGVVDRLGTAVEIHRQAATGAQVVEPLHALYQLIECLCIRHLTFCQRQQHPVAEPRPKADAVGGFKVGITGDTRHGLAHLCGPQPGQFVL